MNSIIFSYWMKQIHHPNLEKDHFHLASTVSLCMCQNQTKPKFENNMSLIVQALLQTLNSMHTFCFFTSVRRHCSRLSHAWHISAFLQGNKDLYFICLKNMFSIIGCLLILVQFFDYIQWDQSRLWNNILKIKTNYRLRWIFKACAKQGISHHCVSDYRFDCARCWMSWMPNQFSVSGSAQNFAGSGSDFTTVQLHRLHKALLN